MAKQEKTAITPTRLEDYPEWYQQVIKASDLAERSAVRGCMVIRPWGYALWENISQAMDAMFKATGVKNAYFPLFIPLSFLEKEAEHVEGFAKECAVVTHHRLEAGADGKLVPAGELAEPLVVRPTSETIIGDSFSRWVSSYRDLPILINQWANIVRWEMRTRLFLRTTEFLWQEGHTAHATAREAEERTKMMLEIYRKMAEEWLAIPVLCGVKTPSERFPGAVDTMCIEAMMQDNKALQAGTSHFLGQNFAKAAEIKFQTAEGAGEEYVWTTSWGTSTRLIGGMIMTHSDDNGLVLPPKVAPSQVVLMPIFKNDEDKARVMAYTNEIAGALRAQTYAGRALGVEIDDRDIGGRNWDWIKKGIPVRVEIGPRDMEKGEVFAGRRDQENNQRKSMAKDEFIAEITNILDDIQATLFKRALAHQKNNTRKIDSKDEFYQYFTPKNTEKPEIHGGFAMSFWCGDPNCEKQIKDDLTVTIRCLAFDTPEEAGGSCICCGKPAIYNKRVVFAKAY